MLRHYLRMIGLILIGILIFLIGNVSANEVNIPAELGTAIIVGAIISFGINSMKYVKDEALAPAKSTVTPRFIDPGSVGGISDAEREFLLHIEEAQRLHHEHLAKMYHEFYSGSGQSTGK